MIKYSKRKKFRSRNYLIAIKRERYSKFADPDTYIYPESEYRLSWDEFFLLSGLTIEKGQLFKEKFIHYYFHSGYSVINLLDKKHFNPYQQLIISYRELSILKFHFPTNYTNFLLNYQYQLLLQKYNMYEAIPTKVKKRFIQSVYKMTDNSVDSIDKFYEGYGKSYKAEKFSM
ncbi:hypothetical protein BCR22_11770 [Enterococcus plantarum]|uniref:hypothetical protein n=1 Tax=Enterococcus plantarum TaxID=1077675 RepID=UPI00084DFF59|nr:hypothetical protein [Enterococcus plantarum]OEG18042.1 hypothetical protein BCR22_11770 [Enterococcus plantarum]